MYKKLLTLLILSIFLFFPLSSRSQILDENGDTVSSNCLLYEDILSSVDTLYAQMRACDSAIAEIQNRISKGSISEQNEILMYQEIDVIKKEKILLEAKLEEYGILAKQLKYQCENN